MDIAADLRSRAAEDRAKAEATALPNVRAVHLRAATAWEEMARKVDFTAERAAENKAAKDAVAE
ncbi:MAG: hypothetical protein JWM38_3 [Sphingomonas bacterium]|nr:hypothetical protein [Sphingomonas bacterium]MDB5683294.1 hypothetical protein [Sphingomonas bacterium]MDB5716576.1 hypothetical protein [Sphingomonas bacterium]